MKRKQPEKKLQEACLEIAGLSECFNAFPVDINPVPGGGRLDWRIAGYPDLLIVGYCEDRQFHVELKIGRNGLNKKQQTWHARYKAVNGSVFICRTTLEFVEVLLAKAREYGWRDNRLELIRVGLQ